MAKNQESINTNLFDLLRSRGYSPTMLDTSGKEIPIPDEAEVFQFNFTKDGEVYGTVTVSIDGLHKLVIYFGDDVANSDKNTTGSDDSWYELLNHLKRFAKANQLSFEIRNVDHLKYDMAKRDHMKKQEKISESYYPMGKKASYSDSVPTVKMVIQHTREMMEGEQRFRNVARIFLENSQGERILAPTTRPGIATIYARHLAEGGLPHDDRWNHINSLCEEYQKMAGFVRATRNGQFNESAQQLVIEGVNHYNNLRETLGKMRGHKGYNQYFESWTPALMEDDTDTSSINELFVQERVDPRIESVMPILSKLHKKVSEMKEVDQLEAWANNLIENNDTRELEEGMVGQALGTVAGAALGKNPMAATIGGQVGSALQDKLTGEEIEEDLSDIAKKVGGAIKTGAKAVGKAIVGKDDDELLRDLKKRAGVGNPQTGKPSMAISDIEKVNEALDPKKRARLDDLIDQYRTATEPDDYYDRGDYEPEEVIDMIRQEFGDKIAGEVEAGYDKMHFPRHGIQRSDPLDWKKYRPQNRITKGGKMYKQDSDYLKNTIKSRYKLSGKSATEDVAEGYNDISVGDYVSYDDGPGTDRWEVVSIEGNSVELRNDQGGTTFADINDVLKEQGVAEAAKWRTHPDAHYHDYEHDDERYGQKRAMGDFDDTEDELRGRTFKDVEGGKLTKRGSDYRKAYIKRSLGKHPEPNLPEGVAEGPGFDKWADERAASQLHKLKKPHPETWHDVDKKLGRAVDKMSQAEKVKKGLAHPDTLKKKGVAEASIEPEQQRMDAIRRARLQREREPQGSDKIDAMLAQQNAQRREYEQTGKFWLKQKDTQEHISDEFIGKAAANKAALELLKQRPELKGNLVITAYGPGEQQGVAEGLGGQKPTITYKDYTLHYDYQTEDDDPEGYSTATTYYFDVFKDGKRVGEAEYFDYFGDLTIRINGKTKKFEHQHPLASQVSKLVSSLPDEQKRDLSDPKFESQGVAESERQPGRFSGAWQILVNGKKVLSFRGQIDQETANRIGVVKAADRGLYNPGSGDKIKIVPVMLDQKQGVAEGSGPKEKQKTPYRDINSPEYRSAANKQKQQMAKDKAAEPGKKLADKIAKKDVKEGQEDLDAILRIIKK